MKTKNEFDNKLLDIYFEEIGKEKLLDEEDEKKYSSLVRKWMDVPKAGGGTRKAGKEAREVLILGNLKLVVNIAKCYRGLGLDFCDLISEGNIGLMKAAERYSSERGAKFSYYASIWIKQAIRKALSSKSRTIRVPRGTVEKKIKILKFKDEFESKNGREPSEEEIIAEFKMTPSRLKIILDSNFQSRSIDFKEDGIDYRTNDLYEYLEDTKIKSPTEEIIEKESEKILFSFIDKLTKKQKYIIKHRFGLDGEKKKTLESIGEEFNVTRERIRQIEAMALNSLKKMYEKTAF